MEKINVYECNINFTGKILASSPENAKEEFITAISEYNNGYKELTKFITVKKIK